MHDLYVWAMSTTDNAPTTHLVKPDPDNDDDMILMATHELQRTYGFGHVTIQLERNRHFVTYRVL